MSHFQSHYVAKKLKINRLLYNNEANGFSDVKTSSSQSMWQLVSNCLTIDTFPCFVEQNNTLCGFKPA